MRRALAAAAAVAAGLVAIVGAQAKSPSGGIDLCGASGCRHIAGSAAHVPGSDAERLYSGAVQAPRHAATPAPFFALHLHWSSTNEQIVYWVPVAKAVRWGGGFANWTYPNKSAERILHQAADGIEPFQVKPTSVAIGGRAVRAPGTYLRLFERGRWMIEEPKAQWMRVTIRTAVPTPWSDGATDILLDRKGPFVYVDGAVFRIPPGVAQRARQRLPLR